MEIKRLILSILLILSKNFLACLCALGVLAVTLLGI
jgi:hypothetical protein